MGQGTLGERLFRFRRPDKPDRYANYRADQCGIVMADLCLDTMTADIEDLATGIGARRLNAVLALLDVPFCSSDVQSFHFSMTENLASLKSNWVHEAGAFGASMAGGFASGFFVFPSFVSAPQKGVE